MQDPATILQGSALMTQTRAAHARLSAALSTLRRARRVSERLCSDWAEFEAALLSQLRAEEELLLPAFDLVHHADAARVRSEHNELRTLSVAIDHAIAVQQLDQQALSSLQTLLDRNRLFQERSLFAWSEQCLRPRTRAEFQNRIRRMPVPMYGGQDGQQTRG